MKAKSGQTEGKKPQSEAENTVSEGKKAVTGRPLFKKTTEDTKTVKAMAALGCRHEDIAKVIETTPKTLRKHFRAELDCGSIEANRQVMQTLFKMATSGKNTAASIFWAKTRCGMSERKREEAGEDGGVHEIVVKLNEA